MPVRRATNRSRNIIGYFPSLKMGRMINFESLIERDLICLLDYEPTVEQFWEQPLTIKYQHDGRQRQYTPDFHVVHNGRNFLVECKPKQFVDDPENQIKFEAARWWCDEREWSFAVVTDEQLAANWRTKNIKLLTQFARYAISPEIKGRIFAFLSSVPGLMRISDVMQGVSPETPQAAIIPILHMAYHHEVFIPLNDAKITVDSPIALVGLAAEKGFVLGLSPKGLVLP